MSPMVFKKPILGFLDAIDAPPRFISQIFLVDHTKKDKT